LIYNIYLGLLAACLVTLLLRYTRLPRYCLWFIPIICLGLLTEILKKQYSAYENLVQRIYQPMECFLLLCFFNTLLVKPSNKRITRVGYIAYLITTFLYYTIYLGTFNKKDYFDFLFEALLVCVLVCLFFLELLNYKGQLELVYFAAFWLNATNLMFYGGNFFAMSYEQIGRENSTITTIAHLLNLFLYGSYFLIFALARKKAKHVQ
jgi:hypothetical protein